jgi:hypothetical protein
MRFRVILEPSDEGGYTVYVPRFLAVLVRVKQRKKHLPTSKRL